MPLPQRQRRARIGHTRPINNPNLFRHPHLLQLLHTSRIIDNKLQVQWQQRRQEE